MNFQGLKEVQKPDFYLDVAIKRATKKASEARAGVRNRDMKTVVGEKTKVLTIARELSNTFSRLIKSFPSMDNLHPFYQELINLQMDVGELKKALGSLDWAGKQANALARQSLIKMKGEDDPRNIKTAFIGRVASILKQTRKYFIYLEKARKIIVKFPSIKTSLFTVSITGFPNVGKSTLLSKITPARPDIQAYAFTTRRLNMGYLKTMKDKIQLIDTPGTLARFNKMNWIEQQAYLAMKFVSHAIIYVFDLTESSYPISDQVRLYTLIKDQNKPLLIYFSKTDLLDDEVEAFCKEHQEIPELKKRAIDPPEMKELLLSLPKH